MDCAKAFDHFVERTFRYELNWFQDARADAKSRPPTFGFIYAIDSGEIKDDWFFKIDLSFEADLVTHDIFGVGVGLHVRVLPDVRVIEPQDLFGSLLFTHHPCP